MNLYKELKINKNATSEEIKKAYRESAKKYHPDKNNGKQLPEFEKITTAYNILSDNSKRKEYDDTGGYSSNPQSINQLALQSLANLFMSIVKDQNYQFEKTNLFSVMQNNLDIALRKENSKHREINKLIKRLQLIEKKISGENTLFNDMIKNDVKNQKLIQNNIQREIEMLNKALEIIKKYRYQVDEDPFNNWLEINTTTSTTSI